MGGILAIKADPAYKRVENELKAVKGELTDKEQQVNQLRTDLSKRVQ
jgi:hypothetical protein